MPAQLRLGDKTRIDRYPLTTLSDDDEHASNLLVLSSLISHLAPSVSVLREAGSTWRITGAARRRKAWEPGGAPWEGCKVEGRRLGAAKREEGRWRLLWGKGVAHRRRGARVCPPPKWPATMGLGPPLRLPLGLPLGPHSAAPWAPVKAPHGLLAKGPGPNSKRFAAFYLNSSRF